MKAFKWLLKYINEYKYYLLLGFLLTSVVTFLNMVNPYVYGHIVDDVIIGNKTGLLIWLISLVAGATLLKSVVRFIYQMIFENISQNVVYNIRDKIYSRLQELDFGFFDKTKTGDIMARMTGDIEAVRHFTAWVMYAAFSHALTFVTVIIILFTINYKFTLILLAITPFVGFLTYRLGHTVKPAFAAIREQFSKLNSVVQENISGNRVVKAFAKEGFETDKFSKENSAFMQKNLNAAKIWGKYLPVLDSLSGTLFVIIILFGGALVIKGLLTLGQLVTFNGYVWALNMPMRMIGWIVNDIQRFAASGEKIIALLETETKIKNSDNPVKKDTLEGIIEFKDVSFGYEGEDILQDISFKAHPGQTIAIVGPTGSGKSTLISLISRFYDCSKGEIIIDGINVKDIDIRTLRENVAVAMQDIFLFSDTIEGNIAYGIPDISMKHVKWAAEVAGAHEFITDFSEGYDTIIGERGVGLSGGQKQRIALARALLKNPSILILDDTTSNVDIETEHEIQKTLKSFLKDKTTFIIAHRISSVKNADVILVFDKGRIIERGVHEELLAEKGYYYSVFINQYGDFDNIYAKEVV